GGGRKHTPETGDNVGELEGGAGFGRRRLASRHEDARPDDGADAERRQGDRPQHAAEPVLALHLLQKPLQRLLGEQLLAKHERSPKEPVRSRSDESYEAGPLPSSALVMP